MIKWLYLTVNSVFRGINSQYQPLKKDTRGLKKHRTHTLLQRQKKAFFDAKIDQEMGKTPLFALKIYFLVNTFTINFPINTSLFRYSPHIF